MALRPIVLCAVAAATLGGWWLRPAVPPAPAVVDIGRPCSPATRQWAEQWRQVWAGSGGLRRMIVLCQPDGRAAVARVDWNSTDGHRVSSWRPVTTFIGTLPGSERERVDMFDTSGRLIQYAVLDREARHVAFYSAASELIGYGRFDPSSGGVRRFNLEGRPQRSPPLPIPSRAGGSAVNGGVGP